MSALVGGCGSGAVEPQTGAHPYALIPNSLSMNGLVSNGLLANGLRFNGLRFNGLRFNDLSTDSFSINDLPQDTSIWIMSYVVSCALPVDHKIRFTVHGAAYELWGSLGLAPELENGPLTDVGSQEWLTACLMARTNSLGQSVEISMRGGHQALATTADELEHFVLADTGFFGNIFTVPAEMHTCFALDSRFPTLLARAPELQRLGRGAGVYLDSSNFPGFRGVGACFQDADAPSLVACQGAETAARCRSVNWINFDQQATSTRAIFVYVP